MKRLIACSLFLWHINLAWGQLEQPGMLQKYIELGHTTFTLANHFTVDSPRLEYTPNYYQLPFKDFFFEVYGARVRLSAIHIDSSMNVGVYTGSFYKDTSTKDAPLFDMTQMKVRISLNQQPISPWLAVQALPTYEDELVTFKDKPQEHQAGHQLFDDTIALNDRLLVEVRANGQAPFLRLHIKRNPSDIQPFMMVMVQDSIATQSDVDFISNQLLAHHDKIYNGADNWYPDWPGQGLRIEQYDFKPATRAALYFRRPQTRDSLQALEYRFDGGRSSGRWQVSDGLIVTPLLQAGKTYTLEVRYASRPDQYSVYHIHTTGYWYQSWLFRIALLTILLIGLVIFSLAQLKKRKRQLVKRNLELRSLYAQLNPHFVFNALGSIQGLINDNQADKANHYLNGFAGLLRSTLQLEQANEISLQEELSNLENYIQLEQLRYAFDYSITTAPSLDVKNIRVPPFLAQPLIENAIKHGVAFRKAHGRLQLFITNSDNDLICTIEDNGPGFDVTQTVFRKGIGLTQERIRLFNRIDRHRRLSLQFHSDAAGTKALLLFKNWLSA